MPAKFEIYRDAKGDFRFRYKAANGQIVAQGQGYSSKAGCLNGIKSIQENAASADVVETDG